KGGNADERPDKTRNSGGNVRAARRAVAQRLQDLSNASRVVVGGTEGRGIARLPSCLRSVVRKEVARFMGRWRVGEAGLRGAKGRTGSRLCWANAEGFLDGGQRLFGRVFSFLRSIRHSVVASSLRRTVAAARTVKKSESYAASTAR